MERLFLIAHIAEHAVAIDAEQVDAVVDVGAIVGAPRAHDHVRGLTALRSRVVTVIDTMAAIGLCCAIEVGDSPRESSALVGSHAQASLTKISYNELERV